MSLKEVLAKRKMKNVLPDLNLQALIYEVAQIAAKEKIKELTPVFLDKIQETVAQELTDKMKKQFKGERGNDADNLAIARWVLANIPKPKDGIDGVNGKDGESIIGPRGAKGESGKDGSSDTGKEIVAKVNELEIIPELQIDASHIKNLPVAKKSRASGGGGGNFYQANLSGTIDGANTVFTFAGVKPTQYSERVFLNYVEQNPVNGDYTINYQTRTVTYAVAPDISLADYPHIIRYHS